MDWWDPRVLAGFSVPAVRRLKAVLPNSISLWPRTSLHLPALRTSDMDLMSDSKASETRARHTTWSGVMAECEVPKGTARIIQWNWKSKTMKTEGASKHQQLTGGHVTSATNRYTQNIALPRCSQLFPTSSLVKNLSSFNKLLKKLPLEVGESTPRGWWIWPKASTLQFPSSNFSCFTRCFVDTSQDLVVWRGIFVGKIRNLEKKVQLSNWKRKTNHQIWGYHVVLVWEIEYSKSLTCLLHPFLLGDGETLVWPSGEGLPKNAVKGSSDVPVVAVNVNPKTISSFFTFKLVVTFRKFFRQTVGLEHDSYARQNLLLSERLLSEANM